MSDFMVYMSAAPRKPPGQSSRKPIRPCELLSEVLCGLNLL